MLRYNQLELDPESPSKFREHDGWNEPTSNGYPVTNDRCVVAHVKGDDESILYDVCTYEGNRVFKFWNTEKNIKPEDVIAWKRVELDY